MYFRFFKNSRDLDIFFLNDFNIFNIWLFLIFLCLLILDVLVIFFVCKGNWNYVFEFVGSFFCK